MEMTFSQKWKMVRGYFIVLLIFWLASLILWVLLGYEGTFLALNQYHLEIIDQSSLYFFTHLADGVILPGILLLVIWRKNPALAVTAALAIFATGILTQAGKMMIFDDWHRPAIIFANNPLVDIVHPHPNKYHSFPSGHATSFATGGLFFAYFLGHWKAWMGLIIGLFTIFLCYSRVTLGVHFPADIFVGSMVGSLGSYLILVWAYPQMERRFAMANPDKVMRITPYLLGFCSLAILAQFVNLVFLR